MENKEELIYVAGGYGMVGSSIISALRANGYSNIVSTSSKELDLRRQIEVENFFKLNKPAVVILAAAKVGGIQENIQFPADFITDNILIESNVIKTAFEVKVNTLMYICSSSIYPANCTEPKEDDLMKGNLDKSNEGYSLAKLFGVKMCEMYRKQYGVNYFSVVPCNLYGVNDRFRGNSAHVIPALITKFHNAKIKGEEKVSIWGTGNAMREFLYTEDFANCCIDLLAYNFTLPCVINIGSGNYLTIRELANKIKNVVGYKGEIEFNSDKPEGQYLRKMNLDQMRKLNLKTKTSLDEGIRRTYSFYVENEEFLR